MDIINPLLQVSCNLKQSSHGNVRKFSSVSTALNYIYFLCVTCLNISSMIIPHVI